MSPDRKNWLTLAATKASLTPMRGGKWRSGASGTAWRMTPRLNGFRMECAHSSSSVQSRLSQHADWYGPVKVIESNGRFVRRVDIITGRALIADDEAVLDETAIQQRESLLSAAVARCVEIGETSTVSGWVAPAAGEIEGWLSGLGYAAHVDKEKNLRLTLKRPRCDGQVRIECESGRIRLTMPLGHWPNLSPASAAALRRLAEAFNDRTALVRISFVDEGKGTSTSAAQVDLSGLPYSPVPNRFQNELWKQMLRGATAGLHLALRQLGLELDVLADAKNHELVEMLDRP